MSDLDENPTQSNEYAEYLRGRDVWWRRVLQAPYKHHLARMALGDTLDIGCGTGRNLNHLRGKGRCIGVDHNDDCVNAARSRGLIAYRVADFFACNKPSHVQFDSLLLAHVLEHSTESASVALLGDYLPFLKERGRVVIITPQELGQREDHTHVQWVDFSAAERIASRLKLDLVAQYSFPLPRFAGPWFRYNEFVTIARKRTN